MTNFNKFWSVYGKVSETVRYINIFHLTWPMSSPYLVKLRCSKLLHNGEMLLFATNYLTTELAHSKLKYLAELLVVMTDQLKIVRIHAWNVHRVHGHKRLDDDASLSL